MSDKFEYKKEMLDQANSDYAESPLELVKAHFAHRGVFSVKGALRSFKIMDDDRSKSLSLEEFSMGLQDFGVPLSEAQMHDLFRQLDKDGQGTINFEEFLHIVQPKMSDRRMKLVEAAFRKIDKAGDGVVTMNDIKRVYRAKEHPKCVSGEWTEAQTYQNFLQKFEAKYYKDGNVTLEEFMYFYACLGWTTHNDKYFELMMREDWGDLVP